MSEPMAPKIQNGLKVAWVWTSKTLYYFALFFFSFLFVFNALRLLELELHTVLPEASAPVARFLSNVDWNTRTINFDGSISKAFNNKVEKYIWRVDDGSSSMEGSKFHHVFKQPGYYEVLFSIVDQNGQSDQASCTLLFPPEEVEQIPTSTRYDDNSTTGINNPSTQEVQYKWVPKGVFFNYSKLSSTTIGDIRSPFVETGCGFSDNSYNSYDAYQNITDRNYTIRNSVIWMVASLIGLGVVFLGFKVYKKKSKSLYSKTV